MKRQYYPIRLFIQLFLCAIFLLACAPKKNAIWFCPMHKHYSSDKPGNCAICGMTLITAGENSHAVVDQSAAPKTSGPFYVASETQSLLGITAARPQKRTLQITLKLPGQVTYEPEIYSALVEYRQLALAAKSFSDSIGGAHFLHSASLRLQQLGLSNAEVRRYAYSESETLRFSTGYAAGKSLITLRVSESDIGLIKRNQVVAISATAFADTKWRGSIVGIGSLVDAKDRSFAVRVLVANNGLLTAQMTVTAELDIKAGSGVSVERSAIFDNGISPVVFVKTSPTEFKPQQIRIIGGNDEFAFVTGVSSDVEVATSAAFLLDSEAKLHAAPAATTGQP